MEVKSVTEKVSAAKVASLSASASQYTRKPRRIRDDTEDRANRRLLGVYIKRITRQAQNLKDKDARLAAVQILGALVLTAYFAEHDLGKVEA